MKKYLLVLALLFAPCLSFGAQQTVNNGETFGQARTKINANFTDLYAQAATKWVTGTAYTADNQMVVYNGSLYICKTTHTAGTFATDLAANRWVLWGAAPVATVRTTAGGGSTTLSSSEAAVGDALAGKAPTANPTFTGTVNVPALTGSTYSGTSLVAAVQAALTANDNAVDVNASTYMLTVLDDIDAATARATLGAQATMGSDDNYVTDAEKTVIGNTSGTNTGDQNAAGVAFTPNGSISATTVQAAIQEVRDEAGGSVDLSAPGPIGGTTPSTGAFTTVTADDIVIAPPPAGETGEIGLAEAPANGTNEVILKAPAALASNVTITLPSGVVPGSRSATCIAGQWWFDANYWYVCVANSSWKRAALATW